MQSRKLVLTAFIGISLLSPAMAQEQSVRSLRRPARPNVDFQRTTNVGNIVLTITNYGTFGDGFAQPRPIDLPSCEYPKGSGIEHLFDGGLWVGARKDDGSVPVTTAAVDAPNLNLCYIQNYAL